MGKEKKKYGALIIIPILTITWDEKRVQLIVGFYKKTWTITLYTKIGNR